MDHTQTFILQCTWLQRWSYLPVSPRHRRRLRRPPKKWKIPLCGLDFRREPMHIGDENSERSIRISDNLTSKCHLSFIQLASIGPSEVIIINDVPELDWPAAAGATWSGRHNQVLGWISHNSAMQATVCIHLSSSPLLLNSCIRCAV